MAAEPDATVARASLVSESDACGDGLVGEDDARWLAEKEDARGGVRAGEEENACDGAGPRGTERIARVLLQPERHRSLSPAAGKEEPRIPGRPANGGGARRARRPVARP